ncbi:Dapper -like protein 2 Dapper antagonist of catenin 2 [Channa argus]|uniref:Dapper-like protein 2 Dapper antagonist of catenin 2 n=1 Tax=Channa argus TaxID=215402 RepID=A0A6G1PUM9_CHAAH|nr:Dapper -like protein 2 Dapper antagonist of catenin 2 [Channa argus]
MAGRRSCVNSLWSGSERVRIGERLRATLAGVLELELLRCKHLEMVDTALDDRAAAGPRTVHPRAEGEITAESTASEPEHVSATSRRQQASSPSDTMELPCHSSSEDCGSNSGDGTVHSSSGRESNSRWSTLSWDTPSDLLSPPTPDPSGMVPMEGDSRPSSGFYSVSGSSLSDSCYSVSSDAAQGGPAPLPRPLKMWEQVPLSGDNNENLWSEGAMQLQQQQKPVLQNSQEDDKPSEGSAVSVPCDLENTGLSFLSDLCSELGDSLIVYLLPLLDPSSFSSISSLKPKLQLDPRYCTDLVSRRTKEVYPYPSPLHAVALQSPLFTLQSKEQSPSLCPEGGPQHDEQLESNSDPALPLQSQQPPILASLTQLEQYISRLADQYHSRVTSSTSDLTSATTPGPVVHRGLCTPGKSHGSTQSLSAFESRSTPITLAGGSVTPCKSLLGNSARVSLSATGKKATRNSINLGNLPSATGEDLNINLHLNLNLNLAPRLNSSRGLVDNIQNGSCGALRSDLAATPNSSTSSISSNTPTPAVRTRPRISTCPSSLSHRSSLEVTSVSGPSSGFGSSPFCHSLDWSSGAPPEAGPSMFSTNAGSAPGSQRCSLIQESSSSPKLSEDSPMVGEISRLSGLSRAVVVGLMEQGVELDIDCFQTDTADEVRGHGKTHLTAQTDQSHDYSGQNDLNPQRPTQLSLSVTHSPQSQSSLTPPLSHSSSPIHPYQSSRIPLPHYSSHRHYQQSPSPSDLPSSTASSPASHPTTRGRSPPRPLKLSPLGATPLSVFHRDAPFQCSLPRTRTSPLEHGGIQPRGGSLRQSAGGSGGNSGWKRVEGEGLYRGKHASHKLIRAATVSSYAKREDFSSIWAEEEQRERTAAQTPKKTSNKLWRGFEGRLWGKESESEREEIDRAEYGYGWRRNSLGSWRKEHLRVKANNHDKRTKADNSPKFSKKKGKEDGERRSSSLRISRRALFRSESQGLLVPHNHNKEPSRRSHWVSSLDVGQGGMGISKDEGARLVRAKEEKCLSSTASLFNLSRSQSLEGSCHSISPLSSPSFSPSPPPRMPLQRSRSLRDLGRKVFGSMRSLSLKRKPSKK